MSSKHFSNALAEVALGRAQDAVLRSHLAACAACRDELERLRALTGAVDRAIAEMVNAEPSPGFAARVHARVADESAARATWWRGLVPALAGGAAVLALAVWLLWPAAKVHAPRRENNFVDSGKGPAPPRVEPSSADKPEETPPKQFAIRRERSAPRFAPTAMPAAPEVLVSADEWNQVLKLYTLAQRGRVNAETVTQPDNASLEQKSTPLVIAQLQSIAPLGELLPSAEPRK